MLLVNARSGSSKIHGTGLFAIEPIPRGTRVWVFQEGHDQTFDPNELSDLSEELQQSIRRYGWLDEEWGRIILSGDDDRFTNHSDDANVRWVEDAMIAVRDIAAGEEITNDYRDLGGSAHFESRAWLMGSI